MTPATAKMKSLNNLTAMQTPRHMPKTHVQLLSQLPASGFRIMNWCSYSNRSWIYDTKTSLAKKQNMLLYRSFKGHQKHPKHKLHFSKVLCFSGTSPKIIMITHSIGPPWESHGNSMVFNQFVLSLSHLFLLFCVCVCVCVCVCSFACFWCLMEICMGNLHQKKST